MGRISNWFAKDWRLSDTGLGQREVVVGFVRVTSLLLALDLLPFGPLWAGVTRGGLIDAVAGERNRMGTLFAGGIS